MRLKIITGVIVMLLAFSNASSQTINSNKPSDPSLVRGKGTLSFKLDGKLYQSSPAQTKCWTSNSVSLTILWASSEIINISWQLQRIKSKGNYRVDRDSIGMVNFSVAGKSYWIRKTDGSNYLNITISSVRDVYNVKLLSGTFEGVLEDKEGKKVRLTEGKFSSEDI